MLLDMDSFEQSVVSNMGSFNLNLPSETITRLREYYSLLTRWNDRLHLVAPCPPEEFAVRHVLESSQKKVVFLREASNRLDLHTTILAGAFEDIPAPQVSFVTCRALDQFMRKLPALINWAPRGSTMLLFGGETLAEQLRRASVNFEQLLIPKSEKRYLFL